MLATQQSIKKYVDDNAGSAKNLLINGCMTFSQRGGVTFDSTTNTVNSDDTVLLDRWILLSDGNDIVDVRKTVDSGGVSGKEDYISLDVETAQKKFGILQVIERDNIKSITGGTASLSFEAKVSNATRLSDIRAVVVAWDGGADAVTSDIISAWGAEGSNPTLVANWTAENTAANLSVTTSWARYTIENISIDTSGVWNVGVFIYQNNVATNDTVTDTVDITNIQLEAGATATSFEYRSKGEELALCQRYYAKTYNDETVPATATAVGAPHFGDNNTNNAIHQMFIRWHFPVQMRVTPTAVFYDVNSGTAGQWTESSGGGDVAVTVNQAGQNVLSAWMNTPSQADSRVRGHITVDAEL
jgi:hypothetical protein